MGDQETRDRQKDGGRDAAVACSALGAVGVITPEPASTALGVGLLIGQGISFFGLGLWDIFVPVEEEKPEDEKKLSSLPSVRPVRLAAVPAPDRVGSVLNNTVLAGAAMIEDSRLVRCSLLRLNSAIVAKRSVEITLQRAAAESALQCLEASKSLYIASLERLNFAAQRTQFAGISVTKADAMALRDQIVSDGRFPVFEQPIIDQIAPSEEELALTIGEVNKVTGATLDDVITGAEIFGLLARGLKRIDLRADFMPAFFTRPPSICL